MVIKNDEELAIAVKEASSLIQQIQDYVGRDFAKDARLRFPRGYIRTADKARKRLGFLSTSHLKSNIAYTMMLMDVQHWLLARTDIAGLVKEMIVKLQIFLLGSIVESVTKDYLKGKCGKNFKGRTQFLNEKSVITSVLRDDLNWLWDLRNRMHLFQLTNTEWLSTDYSIENHNKAVQVFNDLLKGLEANPRFT